MVALIAAAVLLFLQDKTGETNFDDVNSEFATVSRKIRPSLL